jgi:lactoylglutathione lyase
MIASPLTQMKVLQAGLIADPLRMDAELTTFPSGSAMLDVRRAGRGFVMAYHPKHGFGVDELHEDEGFITGYRFLFKEFEPAAQKLRALATDAANPQTPLLSLVVLQSSNIEAAKEFYSQLGLCFVKEQHGQGPAHFAAKMGSLVLEIYPCQGSQAPSPLRLGFRIESVDETLAHLRSHGVNIVREAHDSPWGRRAVVSDPDGNRIELAAA